MKIAPHCRAYLNNDMKSCIEKYISQFEENEDLLYINLLKNGKYTPSKSEATWPVQVEDNLDVIIIETGSSNDDDDDVNKIGTSLKNNPRKYRWKLLQFHENRRPPYCGTWRKKKSLCKAKETFCL